MNAIMFARKAGVKYAYDTVDASWIPLDIVRVGKDAPDMEANDQTRFLEMYGAESYTPYARQEYWKAYNKIAINHNSTIGTEE